MLSGFFGLIAIETSAGLIAFGSVMRTTCCAFDVMKMTGSRKSILANLCIDSFLQDFATSRTQRTNKESPTMDSLEGKDMANQSSESKVTTDHDEIRQWVEERGGDPARVKDTESKNSPGLLRIDYPGYSGGDSLEAISWDEFFTGFDENNLAFLYQEKTKDGKQSRFSKLIDRSSAEEKGH